ncbi:MAG: vWA domain-containing protein [Planctomycetota bacterium]
MNNRYLIVLLCVILCTSCSALAGGGTPGNNKVLLVAMDRSLSMYYNDPTALRIEGAQLMFALAPNRAQVGAVAYGDATEKVVPITVLSSRSQREKACRRISNVVLKGKGDLSKAFVDAQAVLQSSGAGKGSSVVVFSDGKHSKTEMESIVPQLDKFKTKDWRVHTVALTPKLTTLFLEFVSQSTLGNYFKVDLPHELLKSYFKITGDADELFKFQGQIGAIAVLPQTERLILIAIGGNFGSRFRVRIPGAPSRTVSKYDDNVFSFPEKGGDNPGFETFNSWNPVDGIWSVAVTQKTKEVLIGCNLPVEFAIDKDVVRASYLEGESVDLKFILSTMQHDLFKILKKALKCSATITREDGSLACPVIDLDTAFEDAKVKEKPSRAIYSGKTYLFLNKPDSPENYTISLSAVIDCPGGGKWIYTKRTEMELKPGSPLLISTPEKVDFGAHWEDLIPESVIKEILISTMFKGKVNISISSEPLPYFKISKRQFELSGGEEEPAKIDFILNMKESTVGIHEESISFTGKIAETGHTPRDLVVPVLYGIYKYTGSDIEHAGYPDETVVIPLNFTVEPEVPILYKIDKLTGPVELSVSVTGEGKNQSLEVKVPSDVLDGDYVGELEICPFVEGLSPRKQKVILKIQAQPKLVFEPETINIQTDKNGWVETVISISTQHFEQVPLNIKSQNLVSKDVAMEISSEFDTELVPEEGWDAKLILPGEKKSFTLRLYVSSDLPPSKYESCLEVEVGYRGGRTAIVELPVVLELSR